VASLARDVYITSRANKTGRGAEHRAWLMTLYTGLPLHGSIAQCPASLVSGSVTKQ